MLIEKYADEAALFVKVCGRLSANKYVTGYGGNLAWKLEEDVILITPTKMNKGDITPKDLVFINRAGDIAVPRGNGPSISSSLRIVPTSSR